MTGRGRNGIAAMTKIYLAGPDVFLPDAADWFARKRAICAACQLTGVSPLDDLPGQPADWSSLPEWRRIALRNEAHIRRCDAIIANLTPFRGASADSGTLVELGWFLGQGRPVFGYSNTATLFDIRSAAQVAAVPDPLPALAVEGFSLPDNLMIPGAVEYGGGLPITLPPDGINRAFDALDVFELCVAAAARRIAGR